MQARTGELAPSRAESRALGDEDQAWDAVGKFRDSSP